MRNLEVISYVCGLIPSLVMSSLMIFLFVKFTRLRDLFCKLITYIAIDDIFLFIFMLVDILLIDFDSELYEMSNILCITLGSLITFCAILGNMLVFNIVLNIYKIDVKRDLNYKPKLFLFLSLLLSIVWVIIPIVFQSKAPRRGVCNDGSHILVMFLYYMTIIFIFAFEGFYVISSFRLLNREIFIDHKREDQKKEIKRRLILFPLIMFTSWFLCCIISVIDIIFPNQDFYYWHLITTTLTCFQGVLNCIAYSYSHRNVRIELKNIFCFCRRIEENNVIEEPLIPDYKEIEDEDEDNPIN